MTDVRVMLFAIGTLLLEFPVHWRQSSDRINTGCANESPLLPAMEFGVASNCPNILGQKRDSLAWSREITLFSD
jgi:hypothetical protein